MSVHIYVGDCRDVLESFADGSFHACITSPPYWGGLRDYGTPPLVWGGDPACRHDWRDASYRPAGHTDACESSTLQGGKRTQNHTQRGIIEQAWCRRCGAWLGSLGHEPTPQMYVEHLVGIFREVRRVLRPDGTLWLNLGDTHASRPQNDNHADPKARRRGPGSRCRTDAVKPKDLVGIPWMVAFALRDDGWWLRRDIIWAKGRDGCVGDAGYGPSMPENVSDRPAGTHETIFLLTPSEQYYYDAEATRVNWPGGSHLLRDVWLVNPRGYDGAHFATFPPEIPETCIKAGTSEYGVCAACGAPWERVIETKRAERRNGGHSPKGATTLQGGRATSGLVNNMLPTNTTTGWQPTCECGITDVVPPVVLDICAGAGTTGLAADRLGRDAVLVELNPAYAGGLAAGRIEADAGMFAEVSVVSHRVEV